MRFHAIILAIAAALILPAPAHAVDVRTSHALAMHGDPDLPEDFEHFPYANPDAPKGGRIDYAVQGSFDSLNPFIVQGDGARGLFDIEFGYNVFESLMARSRDEAFTLYPLIAESVRIDEDRSFVEFNLDPDARFSDGEPITVDDVIFTFELLHEKGRPLYRNWIGLIEKTEKVGERGVRFTFVENAGREIPLLLAVLPILPEHATDAENFERSTLRPLIGSGPYTIDRVRPGEVVVLKRNEDYWASDHPSKRGFDNYDEIRVNYIRDDNTLFEAFRGGEATLRIEGDTGRWTTGYNFPAVRDGRIIQETFENGLPSGMYGFVMNTRRPLFNDRAVRHALAGLFDFEWANRNLFNGAYERTQSYFDGSDLTSRGIPASDAERELLADFPDAVLPEIMEGEWSLPTSDGSGRDRQFLREGMDALREAGYSLDGRQLVDPDGRPVRFEIMLNGPSGVPVATAWSRTLERVGIRADIRVVDSAQYLQRQRIYDFDVMLHNFVSSLSPGAEQIGRWGSSSRDVDGTFNFAGVAEPVVDTLIGELLNARTEEEFETAVRAYDRVLLSGAYVVPLYHQPDQWVAYWNRLDHPGRTPIYGVQFQTWWQKDTE